ncbi:MAG: tRNA uridine-5-carboxymethylaminomethyl(34) synthesis enzyme MnmG [Candidatus Omnitrophica bacterium]|nr:tRNA uridine-5-carboxymethylaminomethyl(34) synthesis enzyme MnmG [Candidatus Omnitrophota bacterium]
MYDVIVIGAGHAGIESALAASRMGCNTLLVTLRLEQIGHMSCNPAIGGVGKGQLVKEIDALGGEMAKAADACGLQFRILNASKGPAVWSSRAQIDRFRYKEYMRKALGKQSNICLKQAEVISLLVKGSSVNGVRTKDEEIFSKTVVIAPGTFSGGKIHIGLRNFPGGRQDEEAAMGLSESLRSLGFGIMRFKTGTCARLDKATIDFSRLKIQEGDADPRPFSFTNKGLKLKQAPCYITYTNERTHKIIRDNLKYSPLYTGLIKATGVRYCPSIEDKVVKFPDRVRHQVFLEPEGREDNRIYPNGISTSLPEEAQVEMVHSIEGLEHAGIIDFGYGIEHDVVDPRENLPSLETKRVKNLYLAGQINGTTGYEEAAAQGLIAGINAALTVKGKGPFVLERSRAYIGVLIDDLTTKGTDEPYRMFTSRVEYRLLLREDNADIRLREMGFGLGLVSREEYRETRDKIKAVKEGTEALMSSRIKPTREVNSKLNSFGSPALRKEVTLAELLKRPQIDLRRLRELDCRGLRLDERAAFLIETEMKYSGFIERQKAEVERFRHLEKIKVPAGMDYNGLNGLSREIRDKLGRVRPLSLGQALRIPGVTPAAVAVLMVWIKKIGLKDSEKRKTKSAKLKCKA